MAQLVFKDLLMKKLPLVKVIIAVNFILLLLSCQKNSGNSGGGSGGSGGTEPPIVVTSGTDTGIYYNAATICNNTFNEIALTSSGWTKAFEDNFDSDLSKWTPYVGGNASRELQYYKESNVVIENGILQIRAKKETVSTTVNNTQRTFDFTSGQIQSKSTFSANANTPKVRIVARMKLANGFGMQPAFLISGENWPTNGQITMISASGDNRKFYATNYSYGNVVNSNVVRDAAGYITADADLTECFHVYEMEWTKNSLNFYLDGKLVEQKTSGGYITNLFDKSQRIFLYMVVSSELLKRPQIQPGTVSVDWIKVFTSK
jgi:beta-glucanase (GH16 family)